MSATYQGALEQALALDMADRVRLVQAVWDEVASSGAGFVLSEELSAELDRRIARDAEHPEEASPWQDVVARVEGKR
jgi:putative addiction module component (TIGR02574 family)